MRNLSGKMVGRLTVLDKAEKMGGRCAWLCLCSCGKKVTVLQQSLVKYSPTMSCGCLRAEALTKDLLGLKYGLWTVEAKSLKKKKTKGGVYWFCRCECGEARDVSSDSLLGGRSMSCGCASSRPICPQGHMIAVWGRDQTGMCRACIKNRNFIRNYGITLAEYLALWEYQNGKCAICGTEISIELGRPGFMGGCRAELDHEHNEEIPKRKQVRGILCGGRWSGCNRKIGRIDKIGWITAVLNYLQDPPARRFLDK